MADVPAIVAPRSASTRGPLDAAAVRARHLNLVMNLIWNTDEVSRAELARRTGLSRSTVSGIVQELIAAQLVREGPAGTSTGGRRPIILEFVERAGFIVGIEMGASHVSGVVIDLKGRVLGFRDAPCPVRDRPEEALAAMRAAVTGLLADLGIASSKLVGIGLAAASPIDPRRPGRMLPLVMPRWEGYDVRDYIETAFGRPVFVDNDANLGALAERWWGAGRDGEDLAYIKVATGIGAGLLIDGRIFRGSAGVAGEVGHTSIDPSGPQCVCGLRGCLTTMVGSSAILRQVKARLPHHPWSALAGQDATIENVVDAALAGDELARSTIESAGRTLGVGIANMLNLLNPSRVILGGSLAKAGELLIEPLRETLRSRTLAESVANADILHTTLDDAGIALGAATLVLERALNDSKILMAIAA